MRYKSVKGFSGWGQLGILIAFLGAGFFLAFILQSVIAFYLMPAGVPANKVNEEFHKAIMKSENVDYLRMIQIFSTFFIFFIPSVVYLMICHGKNKFWLGFNKHINGWQVLIGFCLIFLANIIATPLEDISKNILTHFHNINVIAQRMEDVYSEEVSALSNLKSWNEFLISLVIMAFFPAMFEEIFFRGALQNLFERWWKAPLMAVIVTSILFSIIHMSIYLFLSRAILGFVLGLMYQRSKNLWVNIVAHFLNNAVALVQLFWLSTHNQKIELDKMDPKVPLWGGLIAVAITYGLFMLFENVSAKNRKQIAFEEQNLLEHANVLYPFPENKNLGSGI